MSHNKLQAASADLLTSGFELQTVPNEKQVNYLCFVLIFRKNSICPTFPNEPEKIV